MRERHARKRVADYERATQLYESIVKAAADLLTANLRNSQVLTVGFEVMNKSSRWDKDATSIDRELVMRGEIARRQFEDYLRDWNSNVYRSEPLVAMYFSKSTADKFLALKDGVSDVINREADIMEEFQRRLLRAGWFSWEDMEAMMHSNHERTFRGAKALSDFASAAQIELREYWTGGAEQ
jgi:hypothetical protein